MAESRLSVEDVSRTGLAATYNAVDGVDTFLVRNDGRVMLHFKNTDGSAETITVQTPKTVNGLAVAELTVTIPATTGDKMVGPFPPGTFNDSSGDLKFTASNGTATTCAVVRLGG